MSAAPFAPAPAIQIEGVSRRFGAVRALCEVSLRIAPGERVAFVGANGSGKTTLLRAVVGLVRVEGRVTIGGVDVAKDPARALAEVAYVPQIAPPLESPVDEVVRAICALRGIGRAEVAAATAELGVSLDAIGRSRVRDLSGGTKQKLMAALALATPARVLICDEPTANLDAAARAAFFAAIDRRPKDGILLLCSHRADEVRRLVDRVVELREGRLVADVRTAAVEGAGPRFRAEVALHEGAEAAARELVARGFRLLGDDAGGRYAAILTGEERTELARRFLAERADEVRDLVVVEEPAPLDAAAVPGAEGAPRLRVV